VAAPALAALAAAGAHLLVATREPDAIAAALGANPGLRVTVAADGGAALARDQSGRTWEVRPPATASLARLLAAIETVSAP
jgi:hypothetical protein